MAINLQYLNSFAKIRKQEAEEGETEAGRRRTVKLHDPKKPTEEEAKESKDREESEERGWR